MTKREIEVIRAELEFIYNTFGEKEQRIKLVEECNEYIESLKDEEIADLAVLSFQFILCHDNVREIFTQKLKRTMDRIDSNFYGKDGD